MKRLIGLLGLFLLVLVACYPAYYSQIYVPPENGCRECYSDFDCDTGEKCVKAKHNLMGCCGTPVNKYGQWRYVPYRYTPETKVPGCSFDVDCPIGFKCVKPPWQLKGVCIKRW